MAFGKSTTSGDAGEPGADIGARLQKMQQHEALTREIYGRSLDEILTIAIERGWDLALDRGFSEGYAAGYERGRTDGYRAAKGRKKSRKKITTAKVVVAITVGKLGWLADTKLFKATATEVLSCIAHGEAELSGQKVPADVTTFLKSPRPGLWPKVWPAQTTLLTEYSRQRAKRRGSDDAPLAPA
jgi:hypothetical protein